MRLNKSVCNIVYNFEVMEIDTDDDDAESLEVLLLVLVGKVVVVESSSLTVNFNANALHIRNNISSTTPMMLDGGIL